MICATGSRDATLILQKHFWAKLGQLKFDLILYSYHFFYCITFLRRVRIFSAVITAVVTGVWIKWKDISIITTICPIIILILQAFLAGLEYMPYENRKQELRELIDLLEPLYNEMERDWDLISLGEFSIKQIEEKTREYEDRRIEIAKNFLKNDAIPNKKSLVKQAKDEADIYLSHLALGG